MIPADVKTTFDTLQASVDMLVAMQGTLSDTVNKSRGETTAFLKQITDARGNPLSKAYASQDPLTAEQYYTKFTEYSSAKLASDEIIACKSAECMKGGVRAMTPPASLLEGIGPGPFRTRKDATRLVF